MGVGGFFKRVFGFILGGIKWVFANTEVDEFIAAYLNELVKEVTRLATISTLGNTEKREAAARFLVNLAHIKGVELAGHIVNLLVEFAYARYKGSVTQG